MYVFSLKYTRIHVYSNAGRRTASADPNRPRYLRLQEQLGLRSAKGPVEIMVMTRCGDRPKLGATDRAIRRDTGLRPNLRLRARWGADVRMDSPNGPGIGRRSRRGWAE